MKRADLYKLVWEKPVTHVAKEFGISDVALRKICAKHGVPTPPLGYWAKLQHGKKVKQTPLPELEGGQSTDIDLIVRAAQSLPPEVTEARQAALQDEAREENRIAVPRIRPSELHPVAAATEKALRKAKPDDEDFVACRSATLPDVRVGPGSIDRVVLLIHTILHGALNRRYEIVADSGLRLLVDEQPLAIRIYETKEKAAHVPTAAELKRQAKEDEWRSKYPSVYRSDHKLYRTWDYFPSGRLALEISDPKQPRWRSDPIIGRWYDRAAKPLEQYLGEMMVALKTGAAVARHQRAKEAEEARLEKEAEERRREQEIQRRLLEKVTAFLTEKADRYARLVKLESLAAHLRSEPNQPGGGENAELYQALEFALANLRRELSADSVNEEIVSKGLLKPDHWY